MSSRAERRRRVVEGPTKLREGGQAIPAFSEMRGKCWLRRRRGALRENLELDLALVRGSGPNGLILRSDVVVQAETAKARPAAGATQAGGNVSAGLPPLPPLGADTKITPLKGPAAALAGYMEQSLSIPTATSFRTLAVDVLDARRKELNAALKAAGRSEKISFTHLIAYALVRTAREMPFITYSFRRENRQPVRVEPGIHLGLAVDTERKDGSRFLVVPVIKNADALDFTQFRAHYEELVGKARDNKLAADDLQGASFTLTNPGGIGTAASVPRLTAGNGAIIAVGALGYPPGFSNANEQTLRSLGISKIMQMTNTYDHRVIQGAQSGDYPAPRRRSAPRQRRLLRNGIQRIWFASCNNATIVRSRCYGRKERNIGRRRDCCERCCRSWHGCL